MMILNKQFYLMGATNRAPTEDDLTPWPPLRLRRGGADTNRRGFVLSPLSHRERGRE